MAYVADHLSLSALEQGFRTAGEASLSRHYQVIWLLAQGRTVPETSEVTGFVSRWIEELLARYNAFGPSSLGDQRRSNGSEARLLKAEILARLRERVEEPPDDGGVWTSSKAAAFIASEMGLETVATQRGWEALKAIGFSLQRPRPRHAGAASLEDQEVFKKTSRRSSKRSASVIRTR